jgi:DNA-directed RNA polymerase sigma subunit (sigma70/sigma32)
MSKGSPKLPPGQVSEADQHLNQLALDYQRLHAEHLGMIFSTVETQKWLHQYLTNKLASDKRKRPYFDQVTVLLKLLEKPKKLSARDASFYLLEARLRWEEYNEILELVPSFRGEASDEIRMLQLQLDRISAEMIELSIKSIRTISSYYGKRHGESADYYLGTAVIGLIKGIPRWNPVKLCFSKYIFSWMLNEISEAFSHRNLITPPGRMSHEIAQLEEKSHELWSKFDRQPTNEELAEALHQPLAYVERLKKEHLSIASLDAPLDKDSEDGETSLHNSLPMSYTDDKGGHTHRIDGPAIMAIIQGAVKESMTQGDGLLGLRLSAEAFAVVHGPHRLLGDLFRRLRQVGMMGLKEELRLERARLKTRK